MLSEPTAVLPGSKYLALNEHLGSEITQTRQQRNQVHKNKKVKTITSANCISEKEKKKPEDIIHVDTVLGN